MKRSPRKDYKKLCIICHRPAVLHTPIEKNDCKVLKGDLLERGMSLYEISEMLRPRVRISDTDCG